MPDGYYRNSKTGLLHREIWIVHNGPVPPGHQVHHKDHDRGNNRIGNLEPLTPTEHERKHRSPRRGFRAWTPAERGAHTRAMWSARTSRLVTCAGCGETFTSTGMRAAYCSKPCRRRHYRKIGIEK
jgi:hypothetical protein